LKRYRLISAVAAIALLVAAPAAIGSGGDGIVGGTAASPGEYPAQGWLVVDTPPAPGFDSECGGTLVGSRWFLTAAHCVVGVTAFAVLLGDNDVQLPNNDWYGVASVDVHAAYNPITNQNDVAMLRLDRAAPYQPLRVIEPSETPIWAPGTVARIVGWGATAEGGPPANLLQEADVRIVGDAPCQSAYELNAPPMDPGTMVCAAEPGRDTCQGDSGGPLMVRDSLGAWALVGITSWGQGCASPEFPGVYTRLGAPGLNDWVMLRHPRASFNAPQVIHSGLPATFTQQSFHPDPGHFTTFNWDFDGDGQYDDGSGSSAVFSFPPGVQTVGLEASRPGGDTASVRLKIAVNGRPTAVAGGPNGYSVREGGSVLLTASGTDPEGEALSYSWDLDRNGAFEVSGQTTSFSALHLDGPTTRAFVLRVCDSAGGCATSSATARVRNAPPRANAGHDRRVKRGRRVRFFVRASDPGRDRLKATWRIAGRTKRGSRVTHVFKRLGLYVVRVTVTDGDGGSTTDRVRVRVARR